MSDKADGTGPTEPAEGEPDAAAAAAVLSADVRQSSRLPVGATVAGRWSILAKLGEGGYGCVYSARCGRTGVTAALKVEPFHRRNGGSECDLLKLDVHVARSMRRLGAGRHVCQVLDCGTEAAVARGADMEAVNRRYFGYSYVAMSLLGDNLSSLRRRQPNGRFSASTALRCVRQIVWALRDLHQAAGFVHRDVKPSNFAVGRGGDGGRIYMYDFGLSRQVVVDGRRRPPRRKGSAPYRGTDRYASRNVHSLREAGMHDDLICATYVGVELADGRLPWRHASTSRVHTMKAGIDSGELFKRCPAELRRVHDYLGALRYADTPDYAWIDGRLGRCMERKGWRMDDPYDWQADPAKAPPADPEI